MTHELPPGWAWARVEDVADVLMGQSPPGHTYNTAGEGVPFFQGKAEFGDRHPIPRKWTTAENPRIAEKGDILISVRAPVGPTNVADRRCAIGRGLAAIRPRPGVNPDFVLWALRTTDQELVRGAQGSTFQAISGDVLRRHEVPLAPQNEQRRVVAALDHQIPLLESARVGVGVVERKLTALTSSLKRAAVTGGLGTGDVPAPARRQVLERRNELAVRRIRDAEPSAMPTACPSDWTVVSLSDLSWNIDYGTSTRCDYDGEGLPVLRIPNVIDGAVSIKDLKRAVDPQVSLEGSLVTVGDVLVVRTNGSKELIGRCGRVGEGPDMAFASYLIRLRLVLDFVDPAWVALVLSAPHWRALLESRAATTAGQYNLSIDKLKDIPIPLPSLTQQQEILALFEAAKTPFAAQTGSLKVLRRRLEGMQHSLLSAAFSGRLAEGTASDEPADVLLRAIAEQRVEDMARFRAGRTVRKTRSRPAAATKETTS